VSSQRLPPYDEAFLEDCARIHRQWHERAKAAAPVRWHRTGKWLTDGERLLLWEYPRAAPGGAQVDLAEAMEIADGLIPPHLLGLVRHRAVDAARRRRRDNNILRGVSRARRGMKRSAMMRCRTRDRKRL
jgi:hypothetical protein